MSRDDPEVGGDAVTALHLHQVAHHHVLGVDVLLLAVADHQGLLKGRRRRDNEGFKKRLVFSWRQFLFGGKRINDVLVFLFFDKEMKCLYI